MKLPSLKFILLAAATLTANQVFAQDIPAAFQPTLTVYTEAARKDCQEMDGGELSFYGGVRLVADFNGDGITDPIIDTHALECTSSATLFGGGSGGWYYDVFISKDGGYQHFNLLAESATIVATGATPVLLTQMHGANCGVSTAEACYTAYFWADGKFRTATSIESPMK